MISKYDILNSEFLEQFKSPKDFSSVMTPRSRPIYSMFHVVVGTITLYFQSELFS